MRINLKNFLVCAIIALVVFGIAAFLIVGYINDRFFTYEIDAGNQETESLDSVKGDSFNLLLVCVDNINYPADKNETAFMMLLRFDKERKQATYTSFPDNTVYQNAAGDSVILENVYKNETPERLCEEVRAFTGIAIDRYAVFTTDFIGRLVSEHGEISFNLPCDINYPDGYSISHGKKLIGSDTARRIVAYDKYESSSESRYKTARSFISALVLNVLDSDNSSGATKLSSLLSSTKTNITPKDISDNSGLIYSYSKLTPKVLDTVGKYQMNEGIRFYTVDIDATVSLFSDYRKINK